MFENYVGISHHLKERIRLKSFSVAKTMINIKKNNNNHTRTKINNKFYILHS